MKIFTNDNMDTTELTSFLAMNIRLRRRLCVAQRALEFNFQDKTP